MGCRIEGTEYYAPNGKPSELYNDLKEKVGKARAEDLFVLAHTPNFIRDVQNELIYNYKNKFPQTPSTLSFKESDTGKIRTFQITEGGIKKGRVVLNPYKEGYKIKSSFINEKERGKGYGKAMYVYIARKMIVEGQNLYSDQIRTESADGIWQYLSELGVTDEYQKIIYAKPLSAFDKNGEIYAENVLEYATSINENTESLSFIEQQETRMMMSEFPEIDNSEELADKFAKAFYKDGLFSPTRESLQPLYSKYEADIILSDVNILGKVKESTEKLKRTSKLYNTTILSATYKSSELNLFGKLKTENPYIIKQDIVEQYGGIENADLSEIKDRTITQEYLDQFKRVPAIYEDGTPIIEEIIYSNAIKLVEDKKIFEAVDALIIAPKIVDTTKLEKKLSTWLLDYGLSIEGFTKDLLPSLKQFLEEPTVENTQSFSDKYREVFNIPVKQREYTTKLENKDRDLVYLETNKTEQELFDEQSLLQTETANIYHKIEKVDFQQMKEAFKLADDVTELQAYKDYFRYIEKPISSTQEFTPISLTNSLEYLINEFIADFNVEKIKNPTNELYNKFIVTEKGIEQKYNDPISIAEIEAHLMEQSKINTALQEYSIISKQMNNLVDLNVQLLTNKYNNRLLAINNFNKVKVLQGDFTKLNRDIVVAKNSTEEFINNENELFELLNKEKDTSIYGRIQKNLNLNYNETESALPTYSIDLKLSKQQQTGYTKINKKYKSADIEGKFDC
jgi:hypothetical protein